MSEDRNPVRQRVAQAVAATGAAFSALLALLLLASWLQLRASDPLASPALETLRARLRDSPTDQSLREEIRSLDLLARRAFFASQWQRRAGGLLLLASVAVTLVALRVRTEERLPAQTPTVGAAIDTWWLDALRSRRWVAASGGLLLAASVAAAFTTPSALPSAGAGRGSASVAEQAFGKDDWPFFRGPGGNGVARSDTAPLRWDGATGKGIAWKVEVPLPGRSSPIVIGDRIFLTGADETTEEVYCFGRDKGELRWRGTVAGKRRDASQTPRTHPDTGLAPSTMASDGERVFAIFPTGDLAAFDLDGKELWSESLGVPENHYGHASSLITSGGRLIVQWDQNVDAKLLAFDAATGAPAWRAVRDAISWSSPVLVDTGTRRELLLTNSRSVAGYDPRSGVLLWRSDCLGGEMGPSAAFADGLVFAANDRAKAVALRPGGEIVWEYKDELPDTASPVATKDSVFLATSYGVLVCLDAKSGKELWKQQLADGFYASPIVLGERLYVLDLKGTMHVVKLARAFEELSRAPLGEVAMATPAFAGGRIYARGERFLYAISGE